MLKQLRDGFSDGQRIHTSLVRCCVLLVALLFSTVTMAQVLLQHNGYELEQSLVNDIISITEFLADQPLSQQDKNDITNWFKVDFPYNPPFWINRQDGYARAVQQIRNTTNREAQLALRDNLFNSMYFGMAEEPEIAHMESFLEVAMRYDPVVFQDRDNKLAITQKRYNWSVLAENGDHVLTRHDFRRFLQVVEFMAGHSFNDKDKADLEQWMRVNLADYPADMTRLRGNVRQSHRQITEIPDDFYTIVKTRESFYAIYYFAFKDTEYDKKISLLDIIGRYNPIFEVNHNKSAVLSQSLIDFHLAIFEVVAGILGEDNRITQNARDFERRHAAAWVANNSSISDLIEVTGGVLATWYDVYSDVDRANTLPKMRQRFLDNNRNWESAIDPVAATYFNLRKVDYIMSQRSFNSMVGSSQQFNQMMDVHNQMDMCVGDPECLGVEGFDGSGNFLGGF